MTTDERQQPTFRDTDPVDLAAYLTDLGKVSEYGPVRVGTRAQRDASTAYPGARFVQTDGEQGIYVYTGTEWVTAVEVARLSATTVITVPLGGQAPLSQSGWGTPSDPHGLVSDWNAGGSLVIAKAGLYQITFNTATTFGSTPIELSCGLIVNQPSNSEQYWRGRGQTSNTGSSGQLVVSAMIDAVPLAAGNTVRPYLYASRATQRTPASETYVTVRRLGPR